VVQDVQNLEDFTPSYFERETTTAPTAEIPFRLYGVVDRIDIDEKNKCFRIADYKSSDKSRADVTEAFFKDLLFQPFLYVFMEKNNPLLSGYVADGAALLVIASYKKKTLTIAQYQAMAERVYAFLKQLANYIKNGTFFICPSDKCRFCPYGAMCRKNHFATLDRVNKCAEKQTLKEWRQ
jgi:ATP-dependent helicase/DNAse subunit B